LEVSCTWVIEVTGTLKRPGKPSDFSKSKPHLVSLYAEGHDGIDNIVVVLLEGLDGLLP